MNDYTEDNLVQKTTADYLHDTLGWDGSIYAMQETFGADGTLGRTDEREVILTRYLKPMLKKFNPGFAEKVYEDGMKTLSDTSVSMSLDAINREKYQLLTDGIPVRYTAADGTKKTAHLKVFDFDQPANNHFLCVREFWMRGSLNRRRRADVVGFVNGVPLVFMELKNVCKDISIAYRDNFCDYRKVVPQIFHFNAFVILANGIDAKIGTHSSKFKFFHAWKRLSEDEVGVVDMETLLKGTCAKAQLMDLFENFIIYDESAGTTAKILARNHQYLGVNKAVSSVANRAQLDGKLGVFWHTQGSGKSYSMVYFTRKVRRKLGGNYTFVVLTDRDELDTQIYKTFAACGIVDHDKDECRAASGKHLKELLAQHKGYVFSLIQKFNEEVRPGESYSERDDVIVISDEAHRSQYGLLALNMRNALPNAGYIGFTGTPLFKDDELTRQVFGDYVSKYDFQRAVDDGATVPLYYDARGDKLGIATHDINEKIAAKLAEYETDEVKPREQLRDAVSPAELKSEALLAILLKTGTAGCNVIELARRMLSAFESVADMVKSDWRTLEGRIKEYNAANPGKPIKGIGTVKTLELAAAFELVRRGYEIGGEDIRKRKVKTPEDAALIFKEAALMGDEQENFLVIPLDAKKHPLVTSPLRVVRGTLDNASVHVREVFKSAIRWGAQSIVIAHNHPSGDPTPSKDDVQLTEQLLESSRILGIPIVDHLIFGSSGTVNGREYISLRRERIVNF